MGVSVERNAHYGLNGPARHNFTSENAAAWTTQARQESRVKSEE
jgi:hypothetical protein